MDIETHLVRDGKVIPCPEGRVELGDDLLAVKAAALQELDAIMRARRDPDADIHAAKLVEARIGMMHQDALACPLLTAEAKWRGISVHNLATAVISKAREHAAQIAKSEVSRQRIQSAIRDATTADEVYAALKSVDNQRE